MTQQTLVILKPDALQRSLIGEIIRRLELKGLKLTACKMVRLDADALKKHYRHLLDKPFYPSIEKFMTGSPVVLQIWEGHDAVETVRQICGVTNSRKAAPGTIRGDLSMSNSANLIHASDSPETAETEIALFFNKNEIFEYVKLTEQVSYSEEEK